MLTVGEIVDWPGVKYPASVKCQVPAEVKSGILSRLLLERDHAPNCPRQARLLPIFMFVLVLWA